MKRYAGLLLFPFLFSCGATNEPPLQPPLPDTLTPPAATHNPGDFSPAPDTATADRTIYNSYLPSPVMELLETELPGWELPRPGEWESYWFDKHKTDSTLVNVVSLDVNCDRQTDYAVLLYHPGTKRTGLWVIRHDAGRYTADSVDSFVNNPGNYGIAVIRESNVQDMYGDKSTSIACDVIDFIKFESASRTYYFTGEEYKYVQTSD